MTGKNYFLAFDLGASSGRAMLGILENGRLKLKEIYRFENRMQQINGHFFWNIFSLFQELKNGLKKCVCDNGIQPKSIAVDTWGVDFVHLDEKGMILSLPYAYRDSRTDGMIEELSKIVPEKELYLQTGIQLMQINSLFQLFSMVKDKSKLLKITDKILFTPDALNYLFSGVAATEFSIASTSEMILPGQCKWQTKLLNKVGIPVSILGKIILPGTIIGKMTKEVATETGSEQIPVIAVAGHDTASAVAAIPADTSDFVFISSGTWSILGTESATPIISDETNEMNFTNEGGVEGTIRFSKNIMGMWLIQECRRIWSAKKNYTWDEIVQMAKKAEPFKFLIDPENGAFLNPENMPEAIASFCEKTGQGKISSNGEIARCIYDSLALKYAFTLNQMKQLTKRSFKKIYIIGGGSNNYFLDQLTSDMTGLSVIAGPTEATAIGNILMQAKALKIVDSLKQIRKIVSDSFDPVSFTPENIKNRDEVFRRFNKIIKNQ